MKEDSRSTSIETELQTNGIRVQSSKLSSSHMCALRQNKNTKDFDRGVHRQPFFSWLIRDAAKRTFQTTSLQAFSKYLVVYVYLNNLMLSVSSLSFCQYPCVALVFYSCFQENSGTSLGL